ncbi:MFS general substrate transporter [Mollisia scopiformis]|uniref:MFS general substrate transporter n=1 Tax=Mollisia scopiformis TaxID=149040 RepID=A0A194XAD1_MOLSC|nr:MFS general substrate transporter [Mollisia scopiformis]KUJ16722.1 MFS general substrate transporter [Mollisia scopiformis]
MPRAPRDSGLQLVVTVYILSYMFRLVNELQNVPRIRLLERAVCEVYYRKHLTGTSLTDGIPELRCKNPTIQNEVVLIMGWKISLDALPGILTGTYFGVLADKYGRRPVLMLSCLGELLSLLSVMFICLFDAFDIFPVRLTLLSTFFLMLGGGGRIFSSIIQTLLAEIGEELTQRRTRRFYQLAAIEMLGNLSAPPIEAWTIPVSVWLPFCITLALYLLVLVTIWFLVPPKVKQRIPIKNQPSPDSSVTQNLLGRPCDGTLPESEENHAFAIPSASTMWEEVWELLKNKTIAMLLFVTFAKRIGFLSEAFFPQYASEFFHMLYSQTPWFSWANYAGSMLSQGVLLPQLTSWLLRQSLEQISIDVGLIEMNLGLLSIGYAAVWLAFSPVLFGIGR